MIMLFHRTSYKSFLRFLLSLLIRLSFRLPLTVSFFSSFPPSLLRFLLLSLFLFSLSFPSSRVNFFILITINLYIFSFFFFVFFRFFVFFGACQKFFNLIFRGGDIIIITFRTLSTKSRHYLQKFRVINPGMHI